MLVIHLTIVVKKPITVLLLSKTKSSEVELNPVNLDKGEMRTIAVTYKVLTYS